MDQGVVVTEVNLVVFGGNKGKTFEVTVAHEAEADGDGCCIGVLLCKSGESVLKIIIGELLLEKCFPSMTELHGGKGRRWTDGN